MNEVTYGKVMPQAVELEEIILGAMLTSADVIHQVTPIISPDDMYAESNQLIFQAAVDLSSAGKPIDMFTLIEQLKTKNTLHRVGGPVFIAELAGKVASNANTEHHCRLLKQKSIRRSLIKIGALSSKDAFDDSKDVFELLDDVDMQLAGIRDNIISSRKTTKEDIFKQIIDRLTAKEPVGHHLFGIPDLDRIVGRAEPGELILVAARPGMGKSILKNTSRKYLSLQLGKRVLDWNLEMTNEQEMRRYICACESIDYTALKNGKVPLEQLEGVMARIKASPVEFDDKSGINFMPIRSRAISMSRRGGIDAIFIDHGGLLSDLEKNNLNEASQIGRTTRLVKQTAKDLGVPIIMLWQLSRAVENRTDRMPRVSDLRDSGNLEQDADKIIFLYRPFYYDVDTFHFRGNTYTGESLKRLTMIDIAKNREGDLGKCLIKFVPEYMRFEPWEHTNGKIQPNEFDYNPVEEEKDTPF